MKKINLFLAAFFAMVLHSCSVDMNTTYLNDSATSMEMNTQIDPSLSQLLTSESSDKINEIKGFSENWKSAYDIEKETKKKKMTKDPDSVRLMKKMFMRYTKTDGQISGFGFKYDKLLPSDLQALMKKSKKNENLEDMIGKWNGKSLTIDLNQISPDALLGGMENNPKSPVTKKDSISASAKKIADDMTDMLKLFKISFSNKLHFENKIKSITGKNSMVKKIDDNTVEIKYSSEDFTNKDKKPKKQDNKIVITTE